MIPDQTHNPSLTSLTSNWWNRVTVISSCTTLNGIASLSSSPPSHLLQDLQTWHLTLWDAMYCCRHAINTLRLALFEYVSYGLLHILAALVWLADRSWGKCQSGEDWSSVWRRDREKRRWKRKSLSPGRSSWSTSDSPESRQGHKARISRKNMHGFSRIFLFCEASKDSLQTLRFNSVLFAERTCFSGGLSPNNSFSAWNLKPKRWGEWVTNRLDINSSPNPKLNRYWNQLPPQGLRPTSMERSRRQNHCCPSIAV